MVDDLQKMREGVAEEFGLALYRTYTEKQAAGIIGISYDTLKRKRLQGVVPYVDMGGESVRYMGFHLADFLLFGVNAKEQPAPKAPENKEKTP